MTTKSAVQALSESLKKDPELFYVYQANIAVFCSDAIHREKTKIKKQYLNSHETLKALNAGAIEFLNHLISDNHEELIKLSNIKRPADGPALSTKL